MALTEFDHGITAIDTGFTRPQFDASHLIVRNGECAFIDTGTTFSVPNLLDALEVKRIAPEQVRYVLLTHVHLDHAGGAGELLRHLPNATAILHPRGARHMIDPERLIAGAIGVYGEEVFHRSYGEIVPIAEDRVRIVEDEERLDLGGDELLFIHTEGHCRHHYCIIDETSNAIFSGDTLGVSYREFDTDKGAFILPAATPTEYDPDAMRASFDRVAAYDLRAAYLTHYSEVTGLPRLLQQLRRFLDFFDELALSHGEDENRNQVMVEKMYQFYGERVAEHGVVMPEQRIHELLRIDAELNVVGIEVWLDRRKKQREKAKQ